MADDEEAVIVCLRVADAGPRDMLPTSTIMSCLHCGEDVYIAPSSIELIATRPLTSKVLCNQCALLAIQNDSDPQFMSAPGATEELRAMGMVNAEDVVRAYLRRANRRR
jgi:hypothetical protein